MAPAGVRPARCSSPFTEASASHPPPPRPVASQLKHSLASKAAPSCYQSSFKWRPHTFTSMPVRHLNFRALEFVLRLAIRPRPKGLWRGAVCPNIRCGRLVSKARCPCASVPLQRGRSSVRVRPPRSVSHIPIYESLHTAHRFLVSGL